MPACLLGLVSVGVDNDLIGSHNGHAPFNARGESGFRKDAWYALGQACGF